jgi:beta-mannanase
MDFNQKFEPKGNKIIHGAGQSFETFSNYWNALEKNKPIIYMTYAKIHKLSSWIEKIKIESIRFPNIILQIGLKLLDAEGKDKTLEIIKGEYDKNLDEFFNCIKEFKNPTFIRIGYEFDKKGKYNPKNFVKAWKHIVDKFRKAKIKNIATVWCACPFNGTKPVKQFYPGEDYVDWFGIDVFYARHLTGKYNAVENFLELAKKYKKPVMVGESTAAEVGVLNGEKSWDNWFKLYFKWIQNHPIIKAFCYINWDWKKDKTWGSPGTWGNCRIEENYFVKEKFINELKDPKYIHNQKIKDFLEKVYS